MKIQCTILRTIIYYDEMHIGAMDFFIVNPDNTDKKANYNGCQLENSKNFDLHEGFLHEPLLKVSCQQVSN